MVEQELVEAYFESNGFLVRQAGGLSERNNRRRIDPLPVIAVMNPRVSSNELKPGTRLFSGDLNRVHAALVGILGWTNTPFSIADMSSDSRQVKYFKQQIDQDRMSACFNPGPELAESGMGSFLRLLVVPALPANAEKMASVLSYLQSLGVDGVLTLRSILENLFRQTLRNNGPEARGVFQILRLVKAYGMARDPQMEIFEEEEGQ